MSVNDAFKTFQEVVNADIEDVREARSRRDLFKAAFLSEPDVREVVPSGSLARGTHKDPIHDVDVIVIFDADQHPDWGTPGTSAKDALDHTRTRVNALLGATNGSHAQAVRLARWRNHAVKCFLDDPDDPGAFTVDAMPALRHGGLLYIPEASSEKWVYCDPESLIATVAKKHKAWAKFAGTVRMLKWWAAEQDIKIKSLVMEVLAIDYLSTDGGLRPVAIRDFFTAAAYVVENGETIEDPANICGPIQHDLDMEAFAERLRSASDEAVRACHRQVQNDEAGAIRHWGNVFGDDFPKPPKSVNPSPAVVPVLPRPVKDTPQG